jgi:hypothetical protein
MDQVVACLPSKHKALISNPSTQGSRRRKERGRERRRSRCDLYLENEKKSAGGKMYYKQ